MKCASISSWTSSGQVFGETLQARLRRAGGGRINTWAAPTFTRFLTILTYCLLFRGKGERLGLVRGLAVSMAFCGRRRGRFHWHFGTWHITCTYVCMGRQRRPSAPG